MLIFKKITAFIFSFLSVIFLLPNIALAQEAEFGTDQLSDLVTATTRDLFDIVVGIVNTVLYFLGGIAVLLFMYAGWLWFTSQGNRDKIDKAKKIMASASIGLAIIFSSYALVNWIFDKALQEAFYGITNPTNRPGYGGGVGIGGGILESHYPVPNATGIPRNTNIYLTFKEPMNVDTSSASSIAAGPCTNISATERRCHINTTNIRLHRSTEPTVNETTMSVVFNPTNPRIFEFDPYFYNADPTQLLGEQTRDIKYQMVLANLRTANNRPAFNLGSYSWYFTVGTYSDITAPTVTSVRPRDGSISARNTIVQINFSEPVNPILAAGVNIPPGSTFSNITLQYVDAAGTTQTAQGTYSISNQYKTVEFIPNSICGVNSCGNNVFCLPGPESFTGTVTVNVRDMVGNPLARDYIWNFDTIDTIDLDPPKMIDMLNPRTNVPLGPTINMTFDKPLLSSSINSSNIKLYRGVNTNMNFWLGLGDSGSAEDEQNNVIKIYHERFDVASDYTATTTSAIMDSKQNCWYPCLCENSAGHCFCNTPGVVCDADSCQTN